MKVAALNWHIQGRVSMEAFGTAIDGALDEGAELVLLPELAILNLLSDAPNIPAEEVPAYLARFVDEWIEMMASRARSGSATIIGGGIFEEVSGGFLNVCPVVLPDGRVIKIAKNRLTTYEREAWQLLPGEGLTVVGEPGIGVAICYDSEFPEAVRAVAEAGAKILCVPAFTETRHGFQRVRWCAQARAVENQVFVLHSSLTGSLGQEPVPTAYGSSAIIAPSHPPFPDNPILAESPLNGPGMAIADLDFAALEECREQGDVRNWYDREPYEWAVRTE